jgi:hypothetical protein
MRYGWLMAASALALSACSSGPDEADNALPVNETTPEIATAAPLPDIPVAFRGTFDSDAVACGANRSEMRLVVDAREMRFHESVTRVTRVTPRDGGAIDVDAVSTGEGITEQRQYRLAMGEGGRLNVTISGSESTRVRCNAPAAANADPAERIPLALSGDGLQLVDPNSGRTRMIAFGTPRTETLALVRSALGDPSATNRCDVAPLTGAQFGERMAIYFENDRFAGWSANPRGGRDFSSMSGVRIGSTRAEMEDSLVAEISQTSLGTEFDAGGLSGVLSGRGSDARIEGLWAGMACIAR